MSNFLNIKSGLNIKIWDIAHMGHGPYGPRPIWAKAHMGQGPYGPGPIWARAHMGPGPLGPGPFLVGRTPHQKTHPGKKSPNCVFWLFLGNKKDAGRPYDHFPLSFAPRSLLCVRKRRIPFYRFLCPVNKLDGVPQEKKYQAGWGPWYFKCALFMG